MPDRGDTLLALLEGPDDHIALAITNGGPSLSRGQFREEIWHAARQLSKLGVRRNDVVALCFNNTLELIVTFIASTWLGAVALPLNTAYQLHEFRFYLDDVTCKWLLLPDSHVLAETAAAEFSIGVISARANGQGRVTLQPKARCTLRDGDSEVELSGPLPDDTALFLHTSGTTGNPKGVPLSHRNMMTTCRNIQHTYELNASDKSYIVMPLFHVHGLMAALFAALYSGGAVILPADGAGFQVSRMCTLHDGETETPNCCVCVCEPLVPLSSSIGMPTLQRPPTIGPCLGLTRQSWSTNVMCM